MQMHALTDLSLICYALLQTVKKDSIESWDPDGHMKAALWHVAKCVRQNKQAAH